MKAFSLLGYRKNRRVTVVALCKMIKLRKDVLRAIEFGEVDITDMQYRKMIAAIDEIAAANLEKKESPCPRSRGQKTTEQKNADGRYTVMPGSAPVKLK